MSRSRGDDGVTAETTTALPPVTSPESDGLDDERLVELHRYGDPEAFPQIYSRFERMVYNLALRMSADPDVAEECTQETFVRVHRHLAKFRGDSGLKTWIFRIAVNCGRSRLRRRSRRLSRFQPSDPERFEREVDARRNPEERTVDRDLAARLIALLPELEPHYREAVILRDIEGLSYRQIGTVLGVRPGTVRSRIARGREALRRHLEAGQPARRTEGSDR